MASVSSCRGEERPPALPVKQRRHSSMDSDSFTPSPNDPKLHNFAYNEVFTEPTDCHATQCPIHQSADPLSHQMRFFSDGNPPPVPKKRLVRTHSFPGISTLSPSPRSPLSPLQRHPQNFDNPLYMMAPIPDACFHEETEDINPPRGTAAPLAFSQLSFDTPDEHLPFLFSNFVDQRAVSQGIQHRHLLFLRSMAQSVEARCMLQGVATEWDVSSYQPQDFLLFEGSKPKQIGDKIYHSLYSPKFPQRVLALRVHKQTDEASSSPTKRQLFHANLQDVIAYFQPSDLLETSATTLQAPTAPSCPSKSDCSPSAPTGSSTENATDSPGMRLPSVQCFLRSGHCVSIERDLPHATLEDFVQQSRRLQSTECLDYDRQVCVLLLQILMGSHHLHHNRAAAAELRPQEIFLVWPSRERDNGESTRKQDASEGWRAFKSSGQKGKIEWENVEEKEKIQALWRTHGTPRVVLKPKSSALSGLQLLASIKVQIEALIQLFLCSRETPASLGAVPPLSKSIYHRGLLHLSSMIQSESRLQMTDMVAMLQVVLWGPRVPFLDRRGSSTTAVHNWLTIKRALLVMKLAEKGLLQDQSALDWEDCMCLQYLSFTDSETIESVVTQRWSTDLSL